LVLFFALIIPIIIGHKNTALQLKKEEENRGKGVAKKRFFGESFFLYIIFLWK